MSCTSLKYLAFILAGAFLMSGCTILGAMHGKSLSEKVYNVPLSEIETLETGQRITVWVKEGASHHGTYRGIELEGLASYFERYARWQLMQDGDGDLPDEEAVVSIELHGGNQVVGDFQGFDQGKLYVSKQHDSEIIAISDIRTITNQTGKPFDTEIMSALIASGNVPLRSNLVLSTDDEKTPLLIHLDEVSRTMIDGKDYRLYGTLIGLPLDILLISGIAQILQFGLL